MDDERDMDEIDEDVLEIMEEHSLDIDEAEEVRDLRDDLGVETDEAIEIRESL